MIAGELDYLYVGDSEAYDDFLKKLFAKKAKRPQNTTEEKAARKVKRKAFWQKLGGGLQNASASVNNVIGFLQPKDQPSNIQANMGHPQDDPTQKGLPTEFIIIGGLVFVGVAVWGVHHYQKNQALKVPPAQ